MDTSENNWVTSGHLIKYEPGFRHRSSSKLLTQKGINHNNSVSPTRAFSIEKLKKLTSSSSNYIKGEQTKRENLKSHTGLGDTI
jgi:hypothetical protein